jgi:hypothetical protein
MRPIRTALVVLAAALLLIAVGVIVSVVLFKSGDSGPRIVTSGAGRMPTADVRLGAVTDDPRPR